MRDYVVYGLTLPGGTKHTFDTEQQRDLAAEQVEHCTTWTYTIPEAAIAYKAEVPNKPGVYLDRLEDVWQVWDTPEEGMDRLADGDDNFEPSGNKFAAQYGPFTPLIKQPKAVTAKELARMYDQDHDWQDVADYINERTQNG